MIAGLSSFFLIVPLVLQLYFGRLDISGKRFLLLSLGNFLLSWILIGLAVQIVNWATPANYTSGEVPSLNVAVFGVTMGCLFLIVASVQGIIRWTRR